MNEQPRASVLHESSVPAAASPPDPLRICTYVTLALICWIVTPAVAVVVFASIGIVAYVRAYRRGLRRSKCKLGDVRLIVAYLGCAWIAGVVGTVAHFTSAL